MIVKSVNSWSHRCSCWDGLRCLLRDYRLLRDRVELSTGCAAFRARIRWCWRRSYRCSHQSLGWEASTADSTVACRAPCRPSSQAWTSHTSECSGIYQCQPRATRPCWWHPLDCRKKFVAQRVTAPCHPRIPCLAAACDVRHQIAVRPNRLADFLEPVLVKPWLEFMIQRLQLLCSIRVVASHLPERSK